MGDIDELALSAYFYGCRLKRLKRETISGYAERLDYLRRWAKSQSKVITQLTRQDIERYMLFLMEAERPVSGITINGRLKMYRQFYRYLVAQDIIDSDPTNGIQYVRQEKRQSVLITPDDFRRVITAVRKRRTFYALRNECMLLVSFDTMVRLRELRSITTEEVKLFPDRILHIMGKGRKERIVSFGEETGHRLLIYLSRRAREGIPGDFLFSTRDGKMISKRNAEHIFERCGKRANPPVKLSPHLIRHSAATLYRHLTGDIQLVGDILGHESLATTEIYTRSSQIGIVQAYTKISPVSHAGI